jgi:hypothetical protein
VLDAITGDSFDLQSQTNLKKTTMYWSFPPNGSVLFYLIPTNEESRNLKRMELPDCENARLNIPLPEPTSVSLAEPTSVSLAEPTSVSLAEPTSVSLAEPNPLLLDVAEFKLDEGEWEEQEEVLRIDNILRRRLGIPLKLDQLEQPWVSKQSRKPHDHKLQLRFRFKSKIAVEGSLLAVEKAPELTSVRLDGKELKVTKRGRIFR